MAEFSKEYCIERNMGFQGDFSIEEEFNQLEKDNCTGIICEGYGFIAIARNQEDQCLVAYRDADDDIVWVEILFKQKN
jgi:hypothetical protein